MNEIEPGSGAADRVDLAHAAEFTLGTMLLVRPSSCEVVIAGKALVLQPRVMQVLVALYRGRGEVLSREDLVESCWEGLSVSKDAINRCISQLRRLAEQGESQAFTIDTVPRVGYRLTVLNAGPDVEEPKAPALRNAAATIAVLPFINMSSDPEQAYFSDGITEDIITDLSRWPSLAVSSRNSVFRFKSKPIDAQQVGRSLGVRFLVEGSVRRIADRIRITAQLIDAESGKHIWADRFDRPITDLFAVQDEVVRTIVATLVGRVYVSETLRARRTPPSSLAAYDLTLRGNALAWDEPEGLAEAIGCCEQAIELDPGYAFPHILLATLLRRKWRNDLSAPRALLDRALAMGLRGIELADNESTGHSVLSVIYLLRQSYDLALRHMERALEINPTNQWNRADYGELLCHVGRAEEGLHYLRDVKRADPYFNPPWYWRGLGLAHFVLRRYADALADFERSGTASQPYALAIMAGCCAKLGLQDRARGFVARCLAGQSEGNIAKFLTRIPFRDAADNEHLIECLRLAGMPE
jgi:adenylate cyclase